jgi:hypothetical protein
LSAGRSPRGARPRRTRGRGPGATTMRSRPVAGSISTRPRGRARGPAERRPGDREADHRGPALSVGR